jgi:hypothetical protein
VGGLFDIDDDGHSGARRAEADPGAVSVSISISISSSISVFDQGLERAPGAVSGVCAAIVVVLIVAVSGC